MYVYIHTISQYILLYMAVASSFILYLVPACVRRNRRVRTQLKIVMQSNQSPESKQWTVCHNETILIIDINV